MKGFKDSKGKFHPISQSNGVRKSRDQTAKTQGVKVRKQRTEIKLEPELITKLNEKLDAVAENRPSSVKSEPTRYKAMKGEASFQEIRNIASLTKDQAVELVKTLHRPLMFYIDAEQGNYFPVQALRFNDRVSAPNIWMLGDYTDDYGDYFSTFLITSPEHWNELVDEGVFIGYRKDGTINEDFKTRDRDKK